MYMINSPPILLCLKNKKMKRTDSEVISFITWVLPLEVPLGQLLYWQVSTTATVTYSPKVCLLPFVSKKPESQLKLAQMAALSFMALLHSCTRAKSMQSCELSQRVTSLFVTLWSVAHQPPLSVGFSRQEHWNALPCPPLGDIPAPGIKP